MLFGTGGRFNDGRAGELSLFGSPNGSTATGSQAGSPRLCPIKRNDNMAFVEMDGEYQRQVINRAATNIGD